MPLTPSARPNLNPNLSLARKIIADHHLKRTLNDRERLDLATAHYVLATQTEPVLSLNQHKMHLNAAITLLQPLEGLKHRNTKLFLAKNYYLRAEIQEQEDHFIASMRDYQRALAIFQFEDHYYPLTPQDTLVFAQTCIGMAGFLIHHPEHNTSGSEGNTPEPAREYALEHPLHYINHALDLLSRLSDQPDPQWIESAYAHQLAGEALTPIHFEDANIAFHTALQLIFQANTDDICDLLSDLYQSMSLLYEFQVQKNPLQTIAPALYEIADMYFTLSEAFSDPDEPGNADSSFVTAETLISLIHNLCRPFYLAYSHGIVCDMLDGLIVLYHCLHDQALPNKALEHELNHADTHAFFAQHIEFLMMELYVYLNPVTRILAYTLPDPDSESPTFETPLIISTAEQNIHYL